MSIFERHWPSKDSPKNAWDMRQPEPQPVPGEGNIRPGDYREKEVAAAKPIQPNWSDMRTEPSHRDLRGRDEPLPPLKVTASPAEWRKSQVSSGVHTSEPIPGNASDTRAGDMNVEPPQPDLREWKRELATPTEIEKPKSRGEWHAKLRELVTGSKESGPRVAVEMTDEKTRLERREQRFNAFFEKYGLTKEFQDTRNARLGYLEEYHQFYANRSQIGRGISKIFGRDKGVREQEGSYESKQQMLRAKVMEKIAPELVNVPEKEYARIVATMPKERQIEVMRAHATLLQCTIEESERCRVEQRANTIEGKGKGLLERGLEKWNATWKKVESGTEKFLLKQGFTEDRAHAYAANVARGTRLVTMTTLFTVPVLFGGIGAGLIYGGNRLMRGAISVFGGAAVGAGAGSAYEKTIGAGQAQSRRESRRMFGTDASVIHEQRMKERWGTKESIADTRKKIEMVFALLFSGGVMAEGYLENQAHLPGHGTLTPEHTQQPMTQADTEATNNLLSLTPIRSEINTLFSIFHHPAVVGSPEIQQADSFTSHIMTPENLPGAGTMPDALESHMTGVHIDHADQLHVSIDRPGEGADQAFRALQHKLEAAGFKPGAPGNSDDINRILSAKDAHELSSYYGFADEHNLSGYMHENDSFQINDQGKIVFTPHDGPHAGVSTVLEDDNSFRTAGGTYQPEHVAAVPEQAPELVQEQTPVPTPRPYDFDGQQAAAEYRAVHGPVEVHPLPPVAAPPGEAVTNHLTEQHNPSVFDKHPEAVTPQPTEQLPVTTPIPESSPVVAAITHSPAWEQYHATDTWSVAFGPDVSHMDPTQLKFRENLFQIVKGSGVGFRPGEHMDAYLDRAREVLSHGMPKTLPGVYEVKGNIIAHGGDLLARQALAAEYMRLHPGVHAFVEHPGPTPAFSLPLSKLGPDGQWLEQKIDLPISPTEGDYLKLRPIL